jgi:anti-sigma regulatory factor (Ser/Thr protein kinase)
MTIEMWYPSKLKQIRRIGLTSAYIAREYYNNILSNEQINALVLDIELIVGEACNNSVKHSTMPENGTIVVHFIPEDRQYVIKIMDQNPEFDFHHIPQPNFDDIPENGYGIYIINSKAHKVVYKREKGWNILTMIKYIDQQ